jgi:cell division protein FtsI/penicillin-binding protein 2
MDQTLTRRVQVARYLMLLPLAILLFQLARFQVLPTQERSELDSAPFSLNQHIETPRGRILDRTGHLLAGNESRYRLYLDNCQLYLYANLNGGGASRGINDVLMAISAASGVSIDASSVVPFLRQMDQNLQKTYGQPLATCTIMADVSTNEKGEQQAVPFWLNEDQHANLEIAAGSQPDASGKYRSGNPLLANLRAESWFFRDYPEDTLASEIIGFSRQYGEAAGNRNLGVIRYYREIGDWGVERFYNDLLQGTREDVTWTVVPVEIGKNLDRAQPPADLVLTINRDIQAEAERLLKNAVTKNEASRGSVLVINPRNGEILAMADYPPANLNDPNGFADIFKAKGAQPLDPNGQVVSLNISAPYEPGSTFKVLTMAAALDSGTVTPNTTYIDYGFLEAGGYLIHNWDYIHRGQQDMTGCLRYSLNTCLAWVARTTGASVYYEYMDRFRIGRLTGVDVTPEIAGVLRRPGDQYWTDATLATNAFGQGVSLTTLQLAVAVGAVANDGTMMTPHVVQRIVSPDGRVQVISPVPLGQPISSETAHTLSEMLANSLEVEGSHALVKGYRIAGKTGTANIPPYTDGKTIASFIGWGPLSNPQVLILIRLDTPTEVGNRNYGSISAAPVFSALATRVFAILGIPPDAQDFGS